MGADDDFVMTIGDDDSVPLLDEEDHVAPTLQKKTKTSRKANGKDIRAEDLDPNFTFDIEGGGVAGVANAWDFQAARQMLKSQVCLGGSGITAAGSTCLSRHVGDIGGEGREGGEELGSLTFISDDIECPPHVVG